MAKILFTAIVADMRNKLNGTVFSRNRYGSYTRTKSTPTNPQSIAQQGVRSVFGNLSQAWRNLTENQRQAWIAAASNFPIIDIFGNPRTLSGNALFQALNQNLILAGESMLVNPPLPQEMPTTEFVSAEVSVLGNNVSMTVSVTLGSSSIEEFPIVVRATQPLSPGVSYFTNMLRTVGYDVANEGGPNPVGVGTLYAARFGVPEVGQKIGIEAYLVHPDTGQTTVPVRFLAIVTQGT
jgi:hypothetical protein